MEEDMWNAVAKRISATALMLGMLAVGAHAQDQTSGDTLEQQQIRQLEKTWADALVKKDQYGLDLVLAPGYVDISGTGEVLTKNQQISAVFSGNYPIETYRATLTSIRIIGDTAIAQGTYSMQKKNGAADDIEKGIFTHVYQRSHASWVCINSQKTIVTEHATAPMAKKKSSAEMPFHIPFTGKKKDKSQDASKDSPAAVTDFAPDNTPDTPAPAQPAATPDQSATPQPQLDSPK